MNAVSWSKANDDTVISGDETGNLVILDVKGNTTRNINFGKHCIFVLECHPFESDIVAFGCRLGLVFIVNITGKILLIELANSNFGGHKTIIQICTGKH